MQNTHTTISNDLTFNSESIFAYVLHEPWTTYDGVQPV